MKKSISDEICFEARTAECADKLSLKMNILSNNVSNDVVINEYKVKNGLNCIEYSKYLSNRLPEQHPVVAYLSPPIMKQRMTASLDLPINAKASPTIAISLCSTNDTAVCTQEVTIVESIAEISKYFTLIAIACAIVLIFLILIIVSICCCCMRKNNKKSNNKINSAVSKMVIKTIPTSISYPKQQKDAVDCNVSDKSTQNMLSNNFYLIQPLDTNIHVSDESSSSSNNNNNKFCNFIQPKNNTSSVLTVESDVISSTSSSAISSSTGDATSITQSNKTNTNNVNSGYMLNECSKNLSISKQALLFAPQTNQPAYSIKSPQQRQTFSNNESAESGYSTPTNHFNKKLFYEVIV